MTKLIAACVQMRSGTNIEANIASASELITEAINQGAEFITTPEMTSFMDLREGKLLSKAVVEENDIALRAFCDLAAKLNVYLLIGSLAIRVSEDKCANRSYLISNQGKVICHYDKIHLFDVELSNKEAYQESDQYQAGDKAVIGELNNTKIGMTICYDLRFPMLYNKLATAGAQIITVPAAFTKVTGEAHWHTLLRARAIENSCFVIAPAQGGNHDDGRKTFGHSLIVDPWGEVLAEAGTEPGVIIASLDIEKVGQTRSRIPNLKHSRPFTF